MPVLIALFALAAAGACGTAGPPLSGPPPSKVHEAPGTPPPGVAASGYAPDGSLVLLTLAGDKVGTVTEGSSKTTWVWPPIVDSHVHLAFYPVGDKLAAHGVGAVVDLGAPETTFGSAAPVIVVPAGPMITRPNGYPLSSWGANGYGVGCTDSACVIETIDRLAAKGARVIKLPLDVGGLPRDFVVPASSTLTSWASRSRFMHSQTRQQRARVQREPTSSRTRRSRRSATRRWRPGAAAP